MSTIENGHPVQPNEILLRYFYSCPIDDAIFPSLDRARDGEGLEARFNAFKIPESNFLVFEATVKSCKGGCQPVIRSLELGRVGFP